MSGYKNEKRVANNFINLPCVWFINLPCICTHENFYGQYLCSSVESTDWTVFWGLQTCLKTYLITSCLVCTRLVQLGMFRTLSLTTTRPATKMQIEEVLEQWRCEHEHMLGSFTQTGRNKLMYNTTGWYLEANWNLTSSNLLHKCSFCSLALDNETWCPN